MTLNEILGRFQNVKPAPNGGYLALCPAHDDRNPSLKIDQTDGGKILLKCFAGCDTKDVIRAAGLNWSDLSPNGTGRPKAPDPIIRTYDYHDASGNLLFRVCRTAGKKFFQQRPDGRGGWFPGLGKGKEKVRPVLYQLPQVLEAVKAGKTIYIVEGEKDANNLAALGLVATTNPMGSCKWRSHYGDCLEGATCIILPDNDEAGRDHARQVAESLSGKAASVKVLELPGLPAKGDVSDWLEQQTGTPEEKKEQLLQLAAEAVPAEKWGPPAETGEAVIICNNRSLSDISADALAALDAKNNPPFLFNRSGQLVTVVTIREKDKLNRTIERPVIRNLGESALRGYMARSADYVRTSKSDTETVHNSCSPPIDVARDILALSDWPFPLLRDVVQVPIMREDGSIMAEPGYDPETALYYAPAEGFMLSEIPSNPSKFDIESAVALLLDAVIDFPFDGGASFANLLAGMMTPVLRNLIASPVPLLVIDKPKQGTGASLLANTIAIIATGEPAYMTTQPEGREKENEWRKRTTSLVLDGRQIVVIDNVEGVLRSPTLCALLTSTTWSDRILGRSEMIERPHRICWMATGNNIRLAGDLPRRCYKVRLDAKHPRPWQREVEFKHPQLLQWVKENRGRLVAAIFTLGRAWIQAGKPEPKNTPILGSFETWTRVIGGILEYAGIPGFLGNLDQMYEKAAEEDGIEGFLEACYDTWGDKPMTTREIKKEVEQNENLQEALPSWMDHQSRGFTRSLGNLFVKNEDVYMNNGLVLKRAGTYNRATKWQIVKQGEL
jgi:5S rRNA maturation endonuclease (ribonuclease M5)